MRSFWEATGSNPDFFGLTHVTFKEHNIFLKHIKHSFWKTCRQTLIHCHEPQSNCKTLNLGLFSPVLPFFPPNVVEQCFFSSHDQFVQCCGQHLEGKKEKVRPTLARVPINDIIDPSCIDSSHLAGCVV